MRTYVRILGIVAGLLSAANLWAISAEEAAKRVQKELQGRVLGAKTVTEDGQEIHIVRILTPDGRVRHIRVDAASGKILKEPAKN